MTIPMKRYINRPVIKIGDMVHVTYGDCIYYGMTGKVLDTGTKKCLVQLGSMEFYFCFYEVEIIPLFDLSEHCPHSEW